jgi:integrase
LPAIKLAIPQNARERVLSKPEAWRLLRAAEQDPNLDIYLFIRLGLGTSLRHREILAARWEHFDPERRRLKVRVKGGGWRQQPLPPAIVALLIAERTRARDPGGWIFPSASAKGGHCPSLRHPFERCVRAAGLDPKEVVPHVLRHTAITWLSSGGVDIKTLQAFSGHKSVSMIMRYAHPQDAVIDAALASYDDPGEAQGQIVLLPKAPPEIPHNSAQSPHGSLEASKRSLKRTAK